MCCWKNDGLLIPELHYISGSNLFKIIIISPIVKKGDETAIWEVGVTMKNMACLVKF